MMIELIRKTLLTLGVCAVCSAAIAAQSDLENDQIVALQEAYKHVQAKEYDKAKELYKKIQATDNIETGLQRAAVEGEGLALLLDLNEQVSEAKGNKVKLRLLRFQRRTTVSYLEKAFKRHPDETLGHMLALAKEEADVSDNTFDGLRFSDEYKRLLAVAKDKDNNPPEEKRLVIPNASDIKIPVVDEIIIPGARTTVIPNVIYKAKGSVNVRSGPGVAYKSIAMLSDNQEVTVIKSIRLSNGQKWLMLKKGEKTGYTSARFLIEVTGTTKPLNETGAKLVKPPTPKTVQKPEDTANASNTACLGRYEAVYLTKTKVSVYANPGGKLRFSFTKNQKINVVKILPTYLIVRTGSKPDNYVCGYIEKDEASLKRVN